MYWVYQTHIFTWRNKPVQAKLMDPSLQELKEKHGESGFHSPLQIAPYGIPLRLTYQMDPRHPFPDNYYDNTGFRLFSERLVKLMQKFEVRAEYFPVSVVDMQGEKLDKVNYFVFHLLEGMLPAMDEVQSGWTGQRDDGIPHLVLDYLKFPHRPLFLCELIYLPLMRDDLKQSIQQQGITGFEFLSPEYYKSGKYGCLLNFQT